MSETHKSDNKYIVYGFFAILAVIIFYQTSIHVMWRDELQTWLVAKESSSLFDLYRNTRYEGHPLLWHLILWASSKITDNPNSIKVINSLFSITSCYLIIRYGRFPLVTRLLLAFGYYFSFEYAIISRCYGIAVLLAVILASFSEKLIRKPLVIGIVLGLMANTSTYGILLSTSFYVFYLIVYLKDKPTLTINVTKLTVPYLLISLFSIFTLLPQKDAAYLTPNDIPYIFRALFSFDDLTFSLIPIPALNMHFWNSNIIMSSINNKIAVLAIAILLQYFIIRSFKKNYPLLICYLYCFLMILAFKSIIYNGFLRHSGTLFVFLVVLVWMNNVLADVPIHNLKHYKTGNLVFMLLVGCNLIAGGIAHYYHARYTFSGSLSTANFIRKNYSNAVLVGDQDYQMTPVAGYLNIKIYSPNNASAKSYVTWNRERLDNDNNDLFDYIDIIKKRYRNDRILLLTTGMRSDVRSKLVYSVPKTTIGDENYFVYEIQ